MNITKIICHFLVFTLLLPSLSWSQHLIDLEREIKEDQKKIKDLQASSKYYHEQASVFYESVERSDGLKADVLKGLTPKQVGGLYAELKPFACLGSGISVATEKNFCEGYVRSCKGPTTCPPFSSISPGAQELLRKMGINPPAISPKKIEDYNEELYKWQRVFHGVDMKVHGNRKDSEIAALNDKIKNLQSKVAQIQKQRGNLTAACDKFLKQTKDKIVLDQGLTGMSGQVPSKISTPQASKYIKALHLGLTRTSALADPQERVASFKNLRLLAEVLACNGHEDQVRDEIEDLENQLLAGYERSGNTDCSTVKDTDRSFNKYSSCMSSFLDSLPTAMNDLTTNVKKVTTHMKSQQPAGVLEKIAQDQISNAVDNLAAVHQIFDLDTGTSTSGKSVNDVCHQINSCGKFNNFVNHQLYKSKTIDRGLKRIPNCGGERLSQAQNRFKELMQEVLDKNQFSSKTRDDGVVANTQEKLSQLGDEYPDLAPLFYSPTFIGQAEIDLDDRKMEMEFKASNCDSIKDGLRKALHENIRIIANPAAKDKLSENLASLAQKGRRMLVNQMRYGQVIGISKSVGEFAEIDELYREVPELRKYPKEQIHHLKMILKHRPELREHYMREFEGNSELICFLFRGIDKDEKRDKVVEREMKFVKGVAKAVGTVVAAVSFPVSGPIIGFVLAGTAASVSMASNLGSISNLSNRLNDAKANQGKVLNQCMESLTRSPQARLYSPELKQKQCSEAVELMARAADIQAELTSTYKSTAMEIGLYSFYLARVSPKALQEFMGGGSHHHGLSKLAGALDKVSGKLKLGHRWEHYVSHGDDFYGVAKSAKAVYYAANVTKVPYVFSDPLVNGYYHASLDEELHKLFKAKGSKPSEAEMANAEKRVRAQTQGMTEAKVLQLINKGA